MYKYDKIFATEEEKIDFVKKCDAEFFGEIIKASESIAKDRDIRFILLSGPSCSGKTSASRVLTETLVKDGRQVISISIDDFFKDSYEFKDSDEDTQVDFDSINALDYECFCKCVKQLKQDGKSAVPIFDFLTGRRSGYRTVSISKDTVVIFEGIQAVYPEITRLFQGECKKIFLCVDTDVQAYGSEFSRLSLRFARRLVRDWMFRGACPELTFKLWSGVVENEQKNIMPYASCVDIRINSFVPYEINVLSPLVIEVLSQLPDISRYCPQAIEIAEKYKNVPEISKEYIPKDSFFTEFIG